MLPDYLDYIKGPTDKSIDIKNEIHSVIYLYNNPITSLINNTIIHNNGYRILYNYYECYYYGYINKRIPHLDPFNNYIVVTSISNSAS